MPDEKNFGFDPSTEKLTTQAEGRSEFDTQRINSLVREMTKAQEYTASKTKKMDEEITSIARMNKEVKEILGQAKISDADVSREMRGVIGSLGNAMGSFSTGMAKVTKGTMDSTTNAIRQYGKAISEDVSVNKENFVTMALSTASPIFGHFAAKFMQTDVFKDAAGAIKNKVKGAITSGLSGVGRVFGIGKEKPEIGNDMSAITDDLADIKMKVAGVPELQKGGVVGQQGYAKVHPAEVVMPYQEVIKVATEAGEIKKEEREGFFEKVIGIYEDFQKNMMDVQTADDEMAWQDRLVKEITELRVSITGTQDAWRIAFERTLMQHPSIRNIMEFSRMMRRAIRSPIRYLFGVYGKYRAQAQRAARSQNSFDRISDVLILFYGTLMPKMDTLIKIAQKSYEYTSGEKVKEVSDKSKSRFERIKDYLAGKKEEGPTGPAGLSGLLSFIMGEEEDRLDLEQVEKAGITNLRSLFGVKRIAKSMGITSRGKLGEAIDVADLPFPLSLFQGLISSTVGGKEFKELQEERWAKEEAGLGPMQMELPFGPQAEKIKDFQAESTKKGTVEAFKEASKENLIKIKESETAQKTYEKITDIAEKTKEGLKKSESIQKFTEKTSDTVNKVKEHAKENKGLQKLGVLYNVAIADNVKAMKDSSRRQEGYAKAKKHADEIRNAWMKDIRSAARGTWDATKRVGARIRKMRIWNMIMALGGWVISALGTASNLIISGFGLALSPVISILGWIAAKGGFTRLSDALRGLKGGGAAKTARGINLMKGAAPKANIATRALDFLKMGPKGMLGATGRFVGKAAAGLGRLAGGAAGLLTLGIEGAMGAAKAKEWGTSGVGGFLGGALGGATEGGAGSAGWGALKGAGIGATVGSIIPGVGTLIGGAVGAVAGGILGFVGGKNIAKAMDAIGGSIKKMAGAVWKFIKMIGMFPVHFVKNTWKKLKESYKKEGVKGVLKTLGATLMKLNPAYWVGKLIASMTKKFFGWMKNKISSYFGMDTPEEVKAARKKVRNVEDLIRQEAGLAGNFTLSTSKMAQIIKQDKALRDKVSQHLKEIPPKYRTPTEQMLASQLGIEMAPARATADAVRNLDQTMRDGMERQGNVISQNMINTTNAITSSVQSVSSVANQTGGGVGGSETGISSGNAAVVDVATSNVY